MSQVRPIVVIGSVNVDLVCRVGAVPRAGETVLGQSLGTSPGGKGANQAVAAARLGAKVHLVGRVGDDEFGSSLLAALAAHHVGTAHLQVSESTSSGAAVVLVEATGENRIIVVPGANAKLSPDDVDAAESLIASASCVLLQLEIPLATVERAIAVARQHGIPVILDPAPAPAGRLPAKLFDVDVLTPNETEALSLLHQAHDETSGEKLRDPKLVAADLLAHGPRNVLLKLGGRGALLMTSDGTMVQAPAQKVTVVDTTAAGDAFTAAYAVGLAEGMSPEDRVHFAVAAGSLACTRYGAQPSLPTRAEVDRRP
jgi:ribokinase